MAIMMSPQLKNIKSEIEEALESLAEEHGNLLAASIRPILYTNLDRGRVEGFTASYSVSSYVKRVGDHYMRLNAYIVKIQVERVEEIWVDIFKNLRNWAYNFLLRKNFDANSSTREIADECATAAAAKILEAHFPYDTDFEPWARVIVINTCLKFFRDQTKKSIVPPQNIVELDETLSNRDDLIQVSQKHREDKSDLANAMVQLSDARRQVIEHYYLDELPLPEIAKIMGKSVGAIHSLHFNALQDLRKILEANRDNT
jgi:RNA polymerase sigma factor (sigma-70 family)